MPESFFQRVALGYAPPVLPGVRSGGNGIYLRAELAENMLRRVRNALAEKQAVDAAGLIQPAVFKASAERVRRVHNIVQRAELIDRRVLPFLYRRGLADSSAAVRTEGEFQNASSPARGHRFDYHPPARVDVALEFVTRSVEQSPDHAARLNIRVVHLLVCNIERIHVARRKLYSYPVFSRRLYLQSASPP